jgi:hypothetical protein
MILVEKELHTTTLTLNHGSGELNPPNGSYLNEFRMHEGVDTSYTKGGGVDDSPYNFVEPELGQLYLGWTEPGEWVKYTVIVKQTGLYVLSLLYTSNRGGEIAISLNDQDNTGPIHIPSTHRPEDPLDWRQWHHWNRMNEIAKMRLVQGIHVLTLHTLAHGNMNYASLDFEFLGEM